MDIVGKSDDPIITSLCDKDQYKDTMCNFVLKKYPDVPVRYKFTNRTKDVKLGKVVSIERMREQLDYCRTLRHTEEELTYLSGLQANGRQMLSPEYIEFLRNFSLPEYELVDNKDGDFSLEFPGSWPVAMPWETISLSLVNQMRSQALVERLTANDRNRIADEGMRRLDEKIKLLQQYPEIRFSEFGTRRRWSLMWQRYVVNRLAEAVPQQIIGTSNVLLAMESGLKSSGTMAHELFMGMFGINSQSHEAMVGSHNKVLREWWDMYGYDLSIALTDTYGSEFFLRDFTVEQARNYKGLRHDSGNPFDFGERVIAYYKSLGIDPKTKLIVFSDGLDINVIIKLYLAFRGRIQLSFGWGTNLTNDLGFRTLSLVVKLLWAAGNSTVKLSDNLAKAMGPKDLVELVKMLMGYTNIDSQVCIY